MLPSVCWKGFLSIRCVHYSWCWFFASINDDFDTSMWFHRNYLLIRIVWQRANSTHVKIWSCGEIFQAWNSHVGKLIPTFSDPASTAQNLTVQREFPSRWFLQFYWHWDLLAWIWTYQVCFWSLLIGSGSF